MSIMRNQQLFSLLGPTCGSNAQTDFALPRLEPAGPQGPGYFIAVTGLYPARSGADIRSAVPPRRLEKHVNSIVCQSLTALPGKPENKQISSLTLRTKRDQCSLYVLHEVVGENVMLKSAMEEIAALTSLGLFVSMIAIWAQVIAVL